MTYDALIKDLKAKKYRPTYFLHGDEPYYIDQLVHHFETEVLDEAEKSFNLTILYGKDVDHKTVIDNARRFPMMAERQVVILKEAQSMKSIAELEKYIVQPLESTLLVISYKHARLDKRTKFAKAVTKSAVVFESKRPYDNQMPAWISHYLQGKGFKIQSSDAALIAEYLGNDLSKVVNELDKMAINLLAGHTISKDDIQEHIGISKDYNVFELQKALGSRNRDKTYTILRYFQANPRNNPLVMVVATLYSFFSKIYLVHSLGNAGDREIQKTLGLSSTFFVKDYRQAVRSFNKSQTEKILHLLRVYDLKSKGVENANFTDQELMQELMYRILSV